MNYEEMSDFEINNLVASALLHDERHWSTWISNNPKLGIVWFVDESNNKVIEFDPCNNPSDAWPIIVENKISIKHDIVRYSADSLVYSKQFDDGFKIFRHEGKIGDTSSRAALRAAMICFLKMKDSQHD